MGSRFLGIGFLVGTIFVNNLWDKGQLRFQKDKVEKLHYRVWMMLSDNKRRNNRDIFAKKDIEVNIAEELLCADYKVTS